MPRRTALAILSEGLALSLRPVSDGATGGTPPAREAAGDELLEQKNVTGTISQTAHGSDTADAAPAG